MVRKATPKETKKVSRIPKAAEKVDNPLNHHIRKVSPKSEGQKNYIEKIENSSIVICDGKAGSGKANPVSCEVMTPNGPVLMGNIKERDIVCTPDGKTSRVLNVYERGIQDIYRITFTNGNFVECTLDHLWKVNCKSNIITKIVDTKHILENFKKKDDANAFSIVTSEACYFESQYIPFDPYLIGYLIGNAHFNKNQIRVTLPTKEIHDKIQEKLGPNYRLSQCKTKTIDYNIVNAIKGGENKINTIIKNLNLREKLSYQKFIPNIYLLNSIEVREKLLTGLLDSDGSSSEYMAEYSTSSKELAENVKFLAESLGGLVRITSRYPKYTYKGEKKIGRLSHRVYIRFNNIGKYFSLSYKKENCLEKVKYFNKHIIENIEFNRQEDSRCIKIDHPNSLYLINHFVPTHNTHIAVGKAVEFLTKEKVDKIIICRPTIDAGESLGYAPGSYDEKLKPWLLPLFDELHKFVDYSTQKLWENSNKLELCPIGLARGRTMENCFIILSEAQNATLEQLRMFLTRIGPNSTMIIEGDCSQSDLPARKRGGLAFLIERLCRIEGISMVHLDDCDIVRHPLIEKIIRNLE